MKKIFLFLFLATWVTGIKAQIVDLQIYNIFSNTYLNNDGEFIEKARIVIQNNGPDDFVGLFTITISDGETSWSGDYSGNIPVYEYVVTDIECSLNNTYGYTVVIDANYEVTETKKDNNYLFYQVGKPRVALISHRTGLIARNLRDTVYLTPGEFFSEGLSVQDLSAQTSIIGARFRMTTDITDCYLEIAATPYHGNQMDDWQSKVESVNYSNFKEKNVSLLAKNSAAALQSFTLGNYWLLANNLAVGETGSVGSAIATAQTDFSLQYDLVYSVIKVRDAIRGDVNGDGVVDYEDFELLQSMIENGCKERYKYQADGINYGAGRILFSQPDFLSVVLLHIWLNNPNDPLVQGLGIGELMSTNMPGGQRSGVVPIANTFSAENDIVIINAPEADVYNIIAQGNGGRIIQKTGQIGEEITLPEDAKCIYVETVKIKNGTTGLFSPAQTGLKLSVYPNPVIDQVNITSPEAGTLSVINLNGQELYSSSINAGERITLSASAWGKGVYLVKLINNNSQAVVKVIK